MNLKTMLNNLIEEEIAKLEQSGECVKLKSLAKRRMVYSLICGILFVLSMLCMALPAASIVLLVYFILMYNTNNVSVITALAKKSPDTPIAEIIKGDMK